MNPGLSLSYYNIWRSVQARGAKEIEKEEPVKEGKSVFEAKTEKKKKRKGKKKVLKRKE